MNKKGFIFLPVFAMLIAGCTTISSVVDPSSTSEPEPSSTSVIGPSSTSVDDSSSTSEPEPSSTSEPIKLESPALSLNEAKTGLIVGEVENASSYKIKVGDADYVPFEGGTYSFSTIVGSYDLLFVAIGDGENYADSTPASWSYSVHELFLTLAPDSENEAVVDWVGTYLKAEVAFLAANSEATPEYAETDETRFTALSSGILSVRVSGGYDVDSNVYIPGEPIQDTHLFVLGSEDSLMLFDSDTTDVSDLFTYKSDVTGSGIQDTVNASIEYMNFGPNGGKSLGFKFKKCSDSGYFRYDYSLNVTESYRGFGFYARGDEQNEVNIQIAFGAYWATYKLGKLPSNWTYYNIDFDDAAWRVNNNDVSISQALALYGDQLGVSSPEQVIALVSEIRFLTFPKANIASNNNTYVYFEDFALLNKDAEPAAQPSVNVYDNYSGALNGGAQIVLTKTAPASIKMEALGQNVDLSVTPIARDVLELKTADNGATLKFNVTIKEDGSRLEVGSVSGGFPNAAALLNDIKLHAYKELVDIDALTETGIGLDQNHTEACDISGARALFFSEYYTGDSSSTPTSGNGWSMMGSNDYLELAPFSGMGGSKALKLKASSNTMRHSNIGMLAGTASVWPKAKHFSFFAKNPSAVDIEMTVRLYKVNKANATVQGNELYCTKVVKTLSASSDWTQYSYDLVERYNYYGFSITLQGNGAAVYPYFDNFFVHGDVYPNLPVLENGMVYSGVDSTLGKVDLRIGVDGVGEVEAMGSTTEVKIMLEGHTITVSEVASNAFTYTGYISHDLQSIKYVSHTGSCPAINYTLEKTTNTAVIDGFDFKDAATLASQYYVEYESSGWQSVGTPTDYIKPSTSYAAAGFNGVTLQTKISSGNTNGWKYRYKSKNTAALFEAGYSKVSLSIYKNTKYDVTGQFFVYFANGQNKNFWGDGTTSIGSRTIINGVFDSEQQITGFGVILRMKSETAVAADTFGYVLIDNIVISK